MLNVSVASHLKQIEITITAAILSKLDTVYIYRVILQTLLSKVTYNWGIHKAINLEEANRQMEVLVTPNLRHCSNKYKLAREGEKDKDEDLKKVFLLYLFYCIFFFFK